MWSHPISTWCFIVCELFGFEHRSLNADIRGLQIASIYHNTALFADDVLHNLPAFFFFLLFISSSFEMFPFGSSRELSNALNFKLPQHPNSSCRHIFPSSRPQLSPIWFPLPQQLTILDINPIYLPSLNSLKMYLHPGAILTFHGLVMCIESKCHTYPDYVFCPKSYLF